MINICITKCSYSGLHCHHTDCDKLPEYHDHIISDVYYIKLGTTIAEITNGGSFSAEYYCRPCIDKLYQEIKLKLDSRLWPMH